MKTLFCLYFFLLLGLYSFSQPLTLEQQQAINNYIDFTNSCADNLAKVMECLDEYFDNAELYRKKITRNLGKGYKCSGSSIVKEYQKAILESRVLPNPVALKLNQLIGSQDSIYNTINHACEEMEEYLKQRKYEYDKLEKSDILLEKIHKAFKTFAINRDMLEKEIEEVYLNYSNLQAGKSYDIAYNQMSRILNEDIILFKTWKYNFSGETPTRSFPFQNLINNFNKIHEIANAVEDDLKFDRLEKVNYKNFLMAATGQVEILKGGLITDYNYHVKSDDNFSNEAYNDLILYHNQFLVTIYNDFADDAQRSGYTIPKKTFYCPVFMLKPTSMDTSSYFSHKTYDTQIQFTVTPVYAPIDKNTIEALNNYIEFINEETEETNLVINQLTDYHSKAISSLDIDFSSNNVKGPETFEGVKDNELRKNHYVKTLRDSKHIPELYRESLNKQLEILYDIIEVRTSLVNNLAEYSKDMEYKKDNFRKCFKIIHRCENIINEFDSRKLKLVDDIERIFEGYIITPDTSDYWRISGNGLKDVAKESFYVMQAIKTYVQDTTNQLPDTEELNQKLRMMYFNKATSMGTIQRLGTNNQLCPYNYYDNVLVTASEIVNKTESLQTLLSNQPNVTVYENLSFIYNDLIKNYHDFIWLATAEHEMARARNQAPVYLLKEIKETLYLKLSYPELGPDELPLLSDDDKPDDNVPRSPMYNYAMNNLVLVIDESSSMSSEDRLPLFVMTFKELAKIMRPEDKVSIVTFSGDPIVKLNSTSFADTVAIFNTLKNFKYRGSTNPDDCIELAYKTLEKSYIEGGNNRLLIITDGTFKVEKKTTNLVIKKAKDRMFLSIFKYGERGKTFITLEQLTSDGYGNFEIITLENAYEKLEAEVKAIKR